LYVIGRIKDMLIIAGRNIAPQDVEFTAEQAHAMCRKGCSVAFSMETTGQATDTVVVAVEIKQEVNAKQHDDILNAIAQQVLAEHSVVHLTVLLLSPRTVLKTTSGKVRRQALFMVHGPCCRV
jgi:acyl-CoA synthetase (AMP-forming)/AMP-acid ligase II